MVTRNSPSTFYLGADGPAGFEYDLASLFAAELARLSTEPPTEAEVYATASPGKWEFLRSLGIPQERLFNSRTLDFAEEVLAATGGQGVDVARYGY